MSNDGDLVTTDHKREVIGLAMKTFWHQEVILYFGDWETVSDGAEGRHQSNTQYNAFEFSFKGPTVRWFGARQSNHGCAEVYIDGEFQQCIDNYAPTPQQNVIKFEKTDLSNSRIHTLRVVVKKERNSRATDCYQDVSSIQAVTPVSYPAEIAHAMHTEYAWMRNGIKPYASPDSWSPVCRGAEAPERGVTLGPGVLNDTFNRNIDYLNRCFASPTYCDGPGWSEWLPAANEGRLLAGAGNTLRWGERADMRAIIDTIVDDIENRMRDDGYYNYYLESDSYGLNYGENTERKNYDRVFWTRGLLAAGMVGNARAHGLLRRMYDWFNASPYLPDILFGGNATNGLPGGPLMYLSPAGTDEDLITTLRYYDQDYWMRELTNKEPLSMSHYPGERPHCYGLLGFEAFVDQYRATGDRKYLDAVRGGWEIYRDNYKHIGGTTAIMESDEIYPPKSYYLDESKNIGETCGSVFWININSKLLQLFPTEEKYATEIEEAIFNVILAAQNSQGNLRGSNRLHGVRREPKCQGTCCEVATAGLIGRLPEYIYSTSEDGIYVNLFAPSEITWPHGGRNVQLSMSTDFPSDPEVSIRVSTPNPTQMTLCIRLPSWAMRDMTVQVNGSDVTSGTPGSYLSLQRTWSDSDTIHFTLPLGFTTVKYTGLDQVEGNLDRYALLYGPILMALQGELCGPGDVPHIGVAPEDLPNLLTPVDGDPLEYNLAGYAGYKYVPYWKLNTEPFTCVPVVQA